MPQYLFKSIGLLFFILGSFYYIYQSLQMGLWMGNRNDFAHLYLAGYLAQKGGDFFDLPLMLQAHRFFEIPTGLNPFVYPPFFALILIPLCWISFNDAWLFFFVLSQAAFFLSLHVMLKIIYWQNRPDNVAASLNQESVIYPKIFLWGILIAFSAAMLPLFLNYSAGQVNTFMLLVLVMAWYLFLKKQCLLSGFILGIGAAIKISPGFLLLYFAWKKQWKVFWSGMITLVLTFVLTLIVFGVDIHNSFFEQVSQMSYGQSTAAEYGQHYHVEPHNQAPSALWYRLFTHNPSTTGVINSPLMAKLFSITTTLFILLLLLYRTPRSKQTHETEYALWIIGGLMIPSLMWDHYLVQLLFPILVAFVLILFYQPRFVWGLALALAFMCIPYHYDNLQFKSGVSTLMMSIRLYGVLLLGLFLILNQNIWQPNQLEYNDEIQSK